MTLVAGVPPDHLAAATLLGDAVYQHDDHHRDLAAVADAYIEFLTDSQTPYYLAANNSAHGDPAPSANLALWVGQASRFDAPVAPTEPLTAPASPFVGPGIVTTPLPQDPIWYTGPGAFRPLKTGVLALQIRVICDFAAAVDPAPTVSFDLWAEDGVNQMTPVTAHPNIYFAGGATYTGGGSTAVMGGTAFVTVVDTDAVAAAEPGVDYPGEIHLDFGIVPVGWDCYPVLTVRSATGGVIDWQVDHIGMQIAKIA